MDQKTTQEFWEFIDRLVAERSLVIDRPRGSQHPRYPGQIYPLDYGYMEGTMAVDGGGLDVWVGTLPSRRPEALLITIDLKKRDAEIKILLGCSDIEIREILQFSNGNSMRAVLFSREGQELAWIKSRQSVRRFLPQDVPEEVTTRLLEAAIQAPSAHNRQPWRFAVLGTEGAKVRLAEGMGVEFRQALLKDGLSPEEAESQVERSYRRIVEAPLGVLLCLDNTEMDFYPDPVRQQAEQQMAVQSVAMAGENLLLAAHSQGLGAVWICAPLFAPQSARSALDLPETWQPQGLLLLGYPSVQPARRNRKPLSEVTRFL